MRLIQRWILVVLSSAMPLWVSAHPLSQFSINHFDTIEFRPRSVRVHLLIDIAEIPAFRELGLLDTDDNARLTQKEIDAYLRQRVPEIRSALGLTIDGAEVPLRADHSDARFYPGLARVTCMQILTEFSANIAPPSKAVKVTFREKSFPENTKDFGQLRLRFLGGLKIPVGSIQMPLSQALEPVPETQNTWLLPRGDVAFSLVPGAVETQTGLQSGFAYVDTLVSPTIIPPQPIQFDANGVIPIFRSDQRQKVSTQEPVALQPRKIQSFPPLPSSAAPAPTSPQPSKESIVQRGQRRLGELIHHKELNPMFVLFALLLAAFYGAAHALTPGHGKTIVAAYLVGSQGTVWHAFYLGMIVTVTHMGSVFIIGLVALKLQASFLGGNLIPVMEGISGLLVCGIGFYLFLSRYRELVRANALASVGGHYEPEHHHHHDLPIPNSHTHDHSHDETSPHSHDHDHSHTTALHSHEGAHHHHGHSHEIPAGASLWDLFILGISGGMVPCPTAIVLLIVAIAIGRIAFGLLLIAAFSFGLAVVLIAVGVLMVTAKQFIDRFSFSGPAIRVLPVFSGILITFIGVWLTVYALIRAGILVVNV